MLLIGSGYRAPKLHKSGYAHITFTKEDEEGIVQPHDDLFVIEAEISNYYVKRVLIDNGNSVNIIFLPAYQEMEISVDELLHAAIPLQGFTRDSISSTENICLPLTIGTTPQRTTVLTSFYVVDCPSAYNIILGRPALNILWVSLQIICS